MSPRLAAPRAPMCAICGEARANGFWGRGAKTCRDCQDSERAAKARRRSGVAHRPEVDMVHEGAPVLSSERIILDWMRA